jgi:hypothetical protein
MTNLGSLTGDARAEKGMPDMIRNERIKLFCSWCNTIAASIITVGVFTPLALKIYGIGEVKNPQLLAGLPWVCIVASGILHLAGQWTLEQLDDGDDE